MKLKDIRGEFIHDLQDSSSWRRSLCLEDWFLTHEDLVGKGGGAMSSIGVMLAIE